MLETADIGLREVTVADMDLAVHGVNRGCKTSKESLLDCKCISPVYLKAHDGSSMTTASPFPTLTASDLNPATLFLRRQTHLSNHSELRLLRKSSVSL